MSSTDRADVIVIGMGVGGEEVAGRLAEAGLDVVGVERELVGGECPYWGCVPSKMMIRAANLLAEARRIPGMAGRVDVTPDWKPVAQRIRDEATDDWNDHVAVERFEAKGGRFVRCEARLVGPGRVAVGDQVIEASRAVVVATGTRPSIPSIPGLADVAYWTNREAIATNSVPASLVVLGAGAVGLELAQVFARFGSEVTVAEALDRPLPLEEPEVGALLADVLARDGIQVRAGATVTGAHRDGDRIAVTLADGEVVTGERLLVAAGRRADLAAVGLGTVGVEPGARWAPVDDYLRVAPGVWAIGDVTGKGPFTHVAMYQAQIVIADILEQAPKPADYKALPRVTFTDPEVGSVGLTERAARTAGIRVRVGFTALPSSARGWIHKTGNEGFVKVVEDAERGVLVGATSVGPSGGEVLGVVALAVHAEVPTESLRRMIYAYPTFHRAIEAAVSDLHDVGERSE